MIPYTKNPDKEQMGGSKEAFRDMLKKDRRTWSERKQKTRRKKRRIDRQELVKEVSL